METDEIIKLVDGVYKNILEKFNPSARQLIQAGKAYLKALHNAAAASRVFNEALAKIATNAQQSGASDIGSALMNIVDVCKEIQDQQMNILKAFYVDMLVPLETNLEKDTKVVQHEQKKFLQQHKIRADNYSKAAATMKRQRKKKSGSHNTDKEIKNIQAVEEHKNKLDAFTEQSFKIALTQERRRYGFVLERHCSLAKHWIAYYSMGKTAFEGNLGTWLEISVSREILPTNIDNIFAKKMMEKIKEEQIPLSASALRKTQSVDASCLDMRSLSDLAKHSSCILRAKSEYNLTSPDNSNWDQRQIVKALYAYISSGENQLSFLEGDRIALVGGRAKGWQFGENLRTQTYGWFPIAYTHHDIRDNHDNIYESRLQNNENHQNDYNPDSSLESTLVDDSINSHNNSYHENHSTGGKMFGDTLLYRNPKTIHTGMTDEPRPGPPPALPAPVPLQAIPIQSKVYISQSHSFCSPSGPPTIVKRRTDASGGNYKVVNNKNRNSREGITNASLHSSNDSGFANEPPPQPEVDYSDEEPSSRFPIRSPSKSQNWKSYTLKSNEEGTLKRVSQSRTNAYVSQTLNNRRIIDDENFTFPHTSDKRINLLKRTKSFWKFGKSDVLEGMSMWKHRDLIQIDKENKENSNNQSYNNDKKNEKIITKYKNEIKSLQSPEQDLNDENNKKLIIQEENIYGVQKSKSATNLIMSSTINKIGTQNKKLNHNDINNEISPIIQNNEKLRKSSDKYQNNQNLNRNEKKDYRKRQQARYDTKKPLQKSDQTKNDLEIIDDNIFGDEGIQGIVMKTVKRHEILKQYYSSEDETDCTANSSDSYDCIVVDDHLVCKDRNSNRYREHSTMTFKTFRVSDKINVDNKDIRDTPSLLPRTKLNKNTNNNQIISTLDSNEQHLKESRDSDEISTIKHDNNSKSYGPWYDLWGKDQTNNKS